MHPSYWLTGCKTIETDFDAIIIIIHKISIARAQRAYLHTSACIKFTKNNYYTHATITLHTTYLVQYNSIQ